MSLGGWVGVWSVFAVVVGVPIWFTFYGPGRGLFSLMERAQKSLVLMAVTFAGLGWLGWVLVGGDGGLGGQLVAVPLLVVGGPFDPVRLLVLKAISAPVAVIAASYVVGNHRNGL